jgi:hypothetical protein
MFFLEYLPSIHGQTRAAVLLALREIFGSTYQFWAIDQSRGRVHRFEAHEAIGESVRNMLAIPPRHEARMAHIAAP